MSDYVDYGFPTMDPSHTNKYLTPVIIRLLDRKVNSIILDIGCGNGWLAERLMQEGYEVYGIDASESGIKLANERIPGRFFLQNINDTQLPKEIQHINFDTIISTEVIEHLYDPVKYLKFCHSILNNNGEIILSTPYHGYLKNLALALTGKMDLHFRVHEVGGHIKFFSMHTLKETIEIAGFKVEKIIGAGRIRFLWKSMIAKAKI